MKKLIAVLLASLLLFSVAFAAEPIDLTTYTDAELEALRLRLAEEIRARATVSVPENPALDLRYASNGTEVRINAYIGTTGDVYIPDEIDGVPVTQIYDGMCDEVEYRDLDVRSLRLPAGLVSIGKKAFQSSYALTHELVMPATLKTIGAQSFCWSNVSGLVLQSDCELGLQAFAMGDHLQFCYIREGCVVKLGSYAFQDTPIHTAVIPASVVSISNSAFDGCNNLTVYCPAGSYAEQYCQENFIICNTADYEAMVAYYEALYPAQ